MRFLLKVLLWLILGPLLIGLALIALVAAIVTVPILWDGLVARFTAPPESSSGS